MSHSARSNLKKRRKAKERRLGAQSGFKSQNATASRIYYEVGIDGAVRPRTAAAKVQEG